MRRSMVLALLTVLLLALAAPAWAQDRQGREAFVVLSGRADVPQGQQVGDLVVFHGSATVDWGLLAALLLLYALGYGASAWILGRPILRGPTAWILAFLVGWGILRVLAPVPVLGGLVWFAAVVVGLGVLAVAIWRARSASQAAPAAV